MSKFQKRYELYNGEVELVFNESWHRYTVDNVPVPSATTILKVMAKPALEGWAVKMTAEFFRPILKDGIESCSNSQVEEIIKAAKRYRFEVSKEATDIGTAAHNWAEEYILNKIAGSEDIPDLPDNESAVHAIKAFLEWESENDVVYLAAERKVFSREYHFAGTLDVHCIVNGINTILDFKTSKALYEDYYLQLSCYAAALEEETGEAVDQLLVLRIPKDGTEFEAGSVIGKENISDLFTVFRAALHIYKFNDGFKLEQRIKTKIKKLST